MPTLGETMNRTVQNHTVEYYIALKMDTPVLGIPAWAILQTQGQGKKPKMCTRWYHLYKV